MSAQLYSIGVGTGWSWFCLVGHGDIFTFLVFLSRRLDDHLLLRVAILCTVRIVFSAILLEVTVLFLPPLVF